MKPSDLKLNLDETLAAARDTLHIGSVEAPVRKYLPIADKSNFISFVINNALDPTTGTCSPLRLEIYFTIAIAKWYGDIEIEWETPEELTTIYDTLILSGYSEQIADAIGDDYQIIMDMTNDTVEDVTRYSTSLAGMINSMSQNTEQIDKELSDILEKVKNKEGLETLDEIKNVVGTD